MKQRIIEIITELRGVCNVEQLNVSDDILFSEAVSCYRGEKAGEKFSKGLPLKATTEQPNKPSKAQLHYLRNNGIVFNAETITKEQAFKLIKKDKEER